MKHLLVFLIRIYQKTLSPDHGLTRFLYPQGCCRYYPSCSQYTVDALNKYGAFKGSLKGMARIIRCNPWSQGGNDPA